MDAFISSTRPKPTALFESAEIQDRDSVFVASIYPATTPDEARKAINHHKNTVHGPRKAAHEMAAWRYMALKTGKSGLGGPSDFEVKGNSDDDGEKYGGNRILKVMQNQGIIDAVVIVSRWFGGTLLGPVRFTHIEQSASEVCTKFKDKELVEDYVQQLKSLDEEVISLRKQLASESGTSEASKSPSKATNYDQLLESLDVDKAKRLVTARGKAVATLRKIQDQQSATEPTGIA